MRLREILFLGALVCLGCPANGDPDSATEQDVHGWGPPPPPPPVLEPMPGRSVRLQRVHAELGALVPVVRAALPLVDGRLAIPTRDALEAIGPKPRASIRRHAVTVQELARFLGGHP